MKRHLPSTLRKRDIPVDQFLTELEASNAQRAANRQAWENANPAAHSAEQAALAQARNQRKQKHAEAKAAKAAKAAKKGK